MEEKNIFFFLIIFYIHLLSWCMSDEATPYYEDLIDQMTIGHQVKSPKKIIIFFFY
jgi:hypothetical protein